MNKDDLSTTLLGLIVEKRNKPTELAKVLEPLASGLSEARIKIAITALNTAVGSEIALNEAFQAMGMDEASSAIAAKGRSPSGDLEESFRAMGLSEKSAREAAKGRE